MVQRDKNGRVLNKIATRDSNGRLTGSVSLSGKKAPSTRSKAPSTRSSAPRTVSNAPAKTR